MEQREHTAELRCGRASGTLVQINERNASIQSNAILGMYVAVQAN
jgi:hypothetical protein